MADLKAQIKDVLTRISGDTDAAAAEIRDLVQQLQAAQTANAGATAGATAAADATTGSDATAAAAPVAQLSDADVTDVLNSLLAVADKLESIGKTPATTVAGVTGGDTTATTGADAGVTTTANAGATAGTDSFGNPTPTSPDAATVVNNPATGG